MHSTLEATCAGVVDDKGLTDLRSHVTAVGLSFDHFSRSRAAQVRRSPILIAVGRGSLSGINVDRHRGRACIAGKKFSHSCPYLFTFCGQHQIKCYPNRARALAHARMPSASAMNRRRSASSRSRTAGRERTLASPCRLSPAIFGRFCLAMPLTGQQG